MIKKQLLLIISTALTGICILAAMSLYFQKTMLLQEREHLTRHLVESAHSVISHEYRRARDGIITEEEAKQKAIDTLRAMRYDTDSDAEYFWINDMDATMIMHPYRPDLEGASLLGFQDAKGKKLFSEFVNTVKTHREGFVYYLWPKPGHTTPVLKVSFVKGFEPWGWVVGSGIYLDDVNAMFWHSARQYGLAGALVFALILGLSLVLARKMSAQDESVRISEEKFCKAFHASPDGITLSRKSDGLFIDVNDAFLRMFGYSREEVVGRSSFDLRIWVDIQERNRMVKRMDQEGVVHNMQVRLRSKDGSLRTILWTSDVMLLNREEHLIVLLRDITALKESERQLLKSKAELTIKHEQLSDLFRKVELVKMEWEWTMDCIRDVVILLDPEGNVRRCNLASVAFFGKEHRHILGSPWRQLVETEEFTLAGLPQHDGEFYHPRLNRWFCITYYPYSNDGSLQTAGAVITIHDNTETKMAAMELEGAYAGLQEAQNQMLQQEKMASIGQLAAGVAHEINNPTGFVMSNLGTMQKYIDRLLNFLTAQENALAGSDAATPLTDLRNSLKIDHILSDLPCLIEESLDGTQRVKNIVQNLKSFSRIDSAERVSASIVQCMEVAVNMVWNEIKYKSRIRKEYADLPAILCHPQQLTQVFMNLLVNAAQAIENQGEITIRMWHDDTIVYVSVADTGCGIREELQSRIFEPFFTTKEIGTGTGLGLSISYDIIKKHGGDIIVSSSVGRGTIFTIRLPLDGMLTATAGETERLVAHG